LMQRIIMEEFWWWWFLSSSNVTLIFPGSPSTTRHNSHLVYSILLLLLLLVTPTLILDTPTFTHNIIILNILCSIFYFLYVNLSSQFLTKTKGSQLNTVKRS
jgi:hypothetical protein